MYYAEDQAMRPTPLTMAEWENKLDTFLTFNERELLNHPGKVSSQVAEKLVLERYATFDAKRRQAERLEEDCKDLVVLEELMDDLE